MLNYSDMKQERAVVMSLSYVIGFTAAFIGFGVVDISFEPVGEPAAVAHTSLTVLPPADNEPVENNALSVATGVRYDQNLYAIVADEDVLISADDSFGTGVGFFHSVASFELADGGKQVAFCVFETEEAESCTSFVYYVQENTISKLTQTD